MNIIIPAVVSLIISSLALFFSDKIKFGVERLRENTANRRKLVHEWQGMILKELKNENDWDLYESEAYISLRPYLSKEALNILEPVKQRNHIVLKVDLNYKDGLAGNATLILLQDEITRIQKQWKIF